MIWVIYAMAHSLFRAIFVEINRLYKLDAWQLCFTHAVCAVILLLPLKPLMNWPADPTFYLAAALVALIVTIGVVIQLNLSSEQNGRISGISVPLEALAAFVIWLFVGGAATADAGIDLLGIVGLVVAFAVAVLGLIMLRRHDINRRTLSIMVPVAITYAVAGVVTKTVVPVESLVPALLSFVLVHYVVMTIAMGVMLLVKRRVDAGLPARKMIEAGFVTGMLGVMVTCSFVAAVVLAPNPGYVSMMAVLVPVWLFAYHQSKKEDDHSSATAALLIIISVLILILSSWM